MSPAREFQAPSGRAAVPRGLGLAAAPAWVVVALAATLAPLSALAATASSQGIQHLSSFPDRITFEHRAADRAISGAALERRLYGIAGDGNVTIGDRVYAPLAGRSEVVDVQARAVVPRASIARKALQALPVVGNILVVADILNDIRCAEGFGSPLVCDPGQAEVTVTEFSWTPGLVTGICGSPNAQPQPTRWYSNKDAFCSDVSAHLAIAGRAPILSSCTVVNPHVPSGTGFRVQLSTRQSWECTSGARTGWTDISTVNSRSATGCPAGATAHPRIAGACTVALPSAWSPTPIDDAVPWFDDSAGTNLPEVLRELDGAGQGVPFGPGPDELGWTLDPVDAIPLGRETVNHPDGSTTVRDRELVPSPRNGTFENPPSIELRERVTERTYPPGVTPPPLGGDPDPPPGTVTEGPPAGELITCGLPGTPPCKIDETGTPTGAGVDSDARAELAGLVDGHLGLIGERQESLGITWGFGIPSASCSPLEWTTGSGRTFVLDLCNNALVDVIRLMLAWLLAGLTYLYIWRSATGVN